MTTSSIVSKVWNYCNILRDDGVSYGDYLEQLTYLLFLKMAYEYSKPPYSRQTIIEQKYDWESLRSINGGTELEAHYLEILNELGKKKGMLGEIFFKAQNKIQDPAKLYKLVQLIDEENWLMTDTDVKGSIYEGLLEKNAEDTKSGAGQYFTPRALIRAMVECIQPEPLKTIADPACGTGGFFLSSYEYLSKQNLDKAGKEFLKFKTFKGWEIVQSAARLCLMNLYLHGINDIDSEPLIYREDSLLQSKGNYDYVLTNPPFGKKSSFTITNEEGIQKKETLTYERQDFWVTTSNKQLNFVQHVVSMLKPDGKAAVVVPDNVLFEGGAGETVRKNLLLKTDLHTILRLPTGLFYAQGVKANVIFFDNKPASKDPWTKDVWIYDFRTNQHFTLKTQQLKYEHLQDFIECYNPKNRFKRKETEKFKKFTYEEITARDKTNLDIFWLKDESLGDMDNLPDPDVLAQEIVENLEAGLESFKEIVNNLNGKQT